MRPARLLAAGAAGYLAGTAPSADVAVRLAGGGHDLRATGSGNPGAANAIALLGPRWGYGVMAADIAKGAVGAAAGRRLAGDAGAHVAGVAAVVGHCIPVWSGGRGGKGVATSVGQCLATFPAWSVLDLAVAAAAVAASPRWKRRAMTATAISSATWVGAATLWWRRDLPNLWGPRPSAALPLAAAASSAVIMWRFATARTPPARPEPPGAGDREPRVPVPSRPAGAATLDLPATDQPLDDQQEHP